MKGFRHYSFDLWLTLIRSNPSFKIRRAEYFQAKLNPLNKSIEEVQNAFIYVDRMCTAINERTGKQIDAEEMYLMVLYNLCNERDFLFTVDIPLLLEEMEALVFKNSPEIYSSETRKVLLSLRQRDDVSIGILSNTGFIKGEVLRRILKNLEIDQYFDFQIYSDEEQLAKPEVKFFEKMILSAKEKKCGPSAARNYSCGR